MTPAKTTQSPDPIRQPAWRIRAAAGGGALTAFGLGVLFNAGAGDADAAVGIQVFATVLSLAGVLLVAGSAAGATWLAGLRRPQALGSIPVGAAGLLVLSFHDDAPFTATGVLGLIVAPLLLGLILSGVQLLAWQPGAPGRMQREIDRLHAELDGAVQAARGRG